MIGSKSLPEHTSLIPELVRNYLKANIYWMLKYYQICQSKNVFMGNKYFPVEIWHFASRRLVAVHGRLLLLDQSQTTSHLKNGKAFEYFQINILMDLIISLLLYDHLNDLLTVIKMFLNPFLSRTAVWVFIIILLLFCWPK